MRHLPVAAAAVVGLVCSLVLFERARELEETRLRDRFALIAQAAAGSLQARLEGDLEILRALGGLYASSGDVERDEFRAFVQGALELHPHLRAFEWAPRVTGPEREVFEAAARAAGQPDFAIVDAVGPGEVRPGRATRRVLPRPLCRAARVQSPGTRDARGMFLIRTFMDEVRHNERGNEIRMVKRPETLVGVVGFEPTTQ